MSVKNNTGAETNAAGTLSADTVTQNDTGGSVNKQVPKMGLERFIQISPQQSGITALLRCKHKTDAKTKPEWEAVIKELLRKKIQ